MKKLTEIFVTIFFIGNIKFAPGTWGSLFSILILFLLCNFFELSIFILITFFTFLCFISHFLINYYSSFTNSTDSKNIVIDELLGIFFIFLFYDFIFIYNEFVTILLLFLIFRFFDIIKFFPANIVDQRIKSGFGVILDDIIAGIYTILTLVTLNAFI